jgi:hypothetical protein
MKGFEGSARLETCRLEWLRPQMDIPAFDAPDEWSRHEGKLSYQSGGDWLLLQTV